MAAASSSDSPTRTPRSHTSYVIGSHAPSPAASIGHASPTGSVILERPSLGVEAGSSWADRPQRRTSAHGSDRSLTTHGSVLTQAGASSGTRRRRSVSSGLSSESAAGTEGALINNADSMMGRAGRRTSFTQGMPGYDPARRRRSSVASGISTTSSDQGKVGVSVVSPSAPAEKKKVKIQVPWKPLVRCIVHSKVFTFVMFLFTIWVLFGDDLRLAFFPKESDPMFNAITLVAIFLFTVELLLTSVAVADYVGSFFFWLDIIATVSLILDLTFVWEAFIGYDSIASAKDQGTGDEAANQSDLARAGRSSRVGTRVARLLRVFRLIRVTSLYKRLTMRKRAPLHRPNEHDRNSPSSPGEEVLNAPSADASGVGSESRVGRMLSDRTTLRVIVLVLAMLIVIPLVNLREDEMMDSSAQYGADAIYQAWRDFVEAEAINSTEASAVHQRRLAREAWERQVLLYVYYHNYYAECPRNVAGDCAADHLFKLNFLGYLVKADFDPSLDKNNSAAAWGGYISSGFRNWEPYADFWSGGGDWTQTQYIVGSIPGDIKDRLQEPWRTECPISDSSRTRHMKVVGVSLIRDDPCPWLNLRPQEATSYRPQKLSQLLTNGPGDGGAANLVLVFDIQGRTVMEAALNMARTVFIVLILAVGAFKFSADADNLVLHPIERMISKVEHIRRDPLYAIKLGDEQYRLSHLEEKTVMRKGLFRRLAGDLGLQKDTSPKKRGKHRMSSQVAKTTTLETKILENTIIKLGSLLALGFGEAGSEIIGQNLDDDNVMVDAMVPGRKVEAIYGYCQIQDFTMTTEVLQEKTMVFVNQVAEIVHRIVDEHLGAANKNVGEAFLLVWRVGIYNERQRPKIADLSVMSFVQVMAAVNRDQQLAAYREHPALQARKSKYRVSLGFGLHLGWSIEGAIGSEFKIDASYLSSHVNMAVCLESVTRKYGITILISEALVRTCTRRMACFMRGIDNVRLPGTKTPTRLFTVDLDVQALAPDCDHRKRTRDVNRFQERQRREEAKMEKLDASYSVHELFKNDKHIKRMRKVYSLEFAQEFETGYLNYEAGEWDVAVRVFQETAHMLPDLVDGPSCALLAFMATTNYEAPPGWLGFHELTDQGAISGRLAAATEVDDRSSLLSPSASSKKDL